MESFDLFLNKMIDNHIKSRMDNESLNIVNEFENSIIRNYNIDYYTKEGYANYCKIINNLFIIHFIGDAQFVVLNNLFNKENKEVTFKDLYSRLYRLSNNKNIDSIPIDGLTKEEINGILDDTTILDELNKRGFFSKSGNIKKVISNIKNGDLSVFKDIKCYLSNLKAKIELEDLGLTTYMEKVLPYYLEYQAIDDRLIDDVENAFSQKR